MDVSVEKIKISKHILSYASQDLIAISSSIFKNCDLSHFSYERIYPESKQVFLTTCPKITEIFFRNEIYKELAIDNPNNFHSGIYFWENLGSSKLLEDWLVTLNNDFCLANGLIIIEKYQSYAEIFFFGTRLDKALANYTFLNHSDVFRKFCTYFKEKARKIISEAEQQKIIYPSHLSDKTILTKLNFNNENLHDDLLYSRGNDNFRIILSKREHECLRYLARGKTAKETAKILNISPRTIETHIIHSKRKANCQSTSKLIDWYWENQTIN